MSVSQLQTARRIVVRPILITWLLVIFGAVTLMPLVLVQVLMLLTQHSQNTRDMIIAKDDD